VTGRDPVDEIPLPSEVPLPDVEQGEDGLLGQESEATDRLGCILVEVEIADRCPPHKTFMDAAQDDLLAFCRLAFCLRAMAATALEAFQSTLGHRRGGGGE